MPWCQTDLKNPPSAELYKKWNTIKYCHHRMNCCQVGFSPYIAHTHTHTQKQQLLLCPQHLIEATWTVWRKTNTWSELSATREQPSSFLCFLNSSHLELFLPFSPRFSLSFKMFFLPCLFDNITAFWVWPAHGFWVLPELTVLMMMMMIIKQNNKH